MAGINAVGEDTSKNPQIPIKMREIELIRLAVFGFIIGPIDGFNFLENQFFRTRFSQLA